MEAYLEQRRQTSLVILFKSFLHSTGVFLKETGLHGLKFVGDRQLSNWERSYFFIAFGAAFVATCHLISNIYAKWESTPVIIGISPQATSILKVPFPAVTICNMNQVQRSKVTNYKKNSSESNILKILCHSESLEDDELSTSTFFANNNLNISEFLLNHAQPCEKMLLFCKFSSVKYNCADMFQEIVIDEGLCCVFNLLPLQFLFKTFSESSQNLTNNLGFEPVKWDPENGYPQKLPPKFYPRTAAGTGIPLGFSIVLDAQLNEYYCSSTNGPGFKIFFHNPIEIPSVKESGLIISLGYETNFRIEVIRSEAAPNIRSIPKNDRQCIFNNEQSLLFYKLYTRRNCEAECSAMYLYDTCNCTPYYFPKIYPNAAVCSAKDMFCISSAQRSEHINGLSKCRENCLPRCFDLIYLPDGFTSPLATKNYKISNEVVANMSKHYVQENIAVVHLYYRESVYHGDLKNVYIGLTEFLSNVGGVMGLFLGFSFISLAEILYFLILKPACDLIKWKRFATNAVEDANTIEPSKSEVIWHTRELFPKGLSSRDIAALPIANANVQLSKTFGNIRRPKISWNK